MALLTAAELKASREAIEAGVHDVSNAAADEAIADATSDLYAILGYKVENAATTLTLRARGTGLSALFPQERVRSITSVTQDGSTVSAADYELESDGFVLRRPLTYWTNESDVVITGTFGYTAADEKWKLAKRAVKLLAVYYLRDTKPGETSVPVPAGMELERIDSEGVGYSVRRAEVIDDSLTGYPDADRLIERIGRMPVLA